MRQNDSHGNPRPLRGITRSCATTFLRSSMLRRFDSHTSSPQQRVVVINTNMTTIIQTAPGFCYPMSKTHPRRRIDCLSRMLHTLPYDNLFIQLSYLVNVVAEEGGRVVAQLVKALRYKPTGCGFDSRWCNWNFSVT